jgi:hypothetical protein
MNQAYDEIDKLLSGYDSELRLKVLALVNRDYREVVEAAFRINQKARAAIRLGVSALKDIHLDGPELPGEAMCSAPAAGGPGEAARYESEGTEFTPAPTTGGFTPNLSRDYR